MKNSAPNMENFRKSSEVASECPVCHGSGFEIIEKSTDLTRETYGDDRLCEFAVPCSYCNGGHSKEVQRVKEHANIPSAFYNSRLSSFDWNIYRDQNEKPIDLSVQKELIQSFIKDFATWEEYGTGLYIYSAVPGSGKTFLASCICNELNEHYPMNTKFVSVSELIDIQKSGDSTRFGNEYDKDPIKLLCNCKLLVLDDLGQKQTSSEWLNDILFRIIDQRSQNKAVTIITSNLSVIELAKNRIIDGRITERINRICQNIPLPEYCVRAKEANEKKVELFTKLGIIKKKGVQNGATEEKV